MPRRVLGLEPALPPQLIWLTDCQGRRIDQAMGAREPGGVLITCHGGQGVREAVTRVLVDAGLPELAPTEVNAFGRSSRFERGLLELLPRVRGRSAARMVVEALSQRAALEAALAGPGALKDLLALSENVRFLAAPPRVQLWGPVNAGKSSLLNALCGRTLAATGHEPGLTRDVIEGRMQHKGFEIRLFDAPGVWAGVEGVDRDAQELAARWRADSDLTIELVPPGASSTLRDAWVLHSRSDELGEKPVNHISVRDTDTLFELKDRLVGHFYGPLIRLSPNRRFALEPALREDLRALVAGSVGVRELRNRWLS